MIDLRGTPARGPLGLVLLLTAIACIGSPGTARAVGPCSSGSTTFTGNSTGDKSDFSDSLNWSNGTPGGSCDATIPSEKSVTLRGTGSAATLALGGSLAVEGSTNADGTPDNAQFSATTTIASGGAISLTSSSFVAGTADPKPAANPGAAIVSGTITNSGSISVTKGTTGGSSFRQLRVNLTNNADGSVAIHTDASRCNCNSGSQYVNRGAFIVDAGAILDIASNGAGGKLTQEAGGTFANNGRTVVSGAVTHSGGTTSGNPIQLCGDLDASGPGAASFDLLRDTARCDVNSAITADIAAATTVTMRNLTANDFQVGGVAFTNRGTLNFAGDAAIKGSRFLNGGEAVTNEGTINVDANGFTQFQKFLDNKGTVNVAPGASVSTSGTVAGGSSTLDQEGGTFTVGAGATVDTGSAGTRLLGGTIVNGGRFVADSFTHGGGDATGTPIELCGGNVSLTGPGTASFDAVATSGCNNTTLKSDIGAGDTLRLVGSATQTFDVFTPSTTMTNRGTLTAVQSGTRPVQLHGGTLVNQGTFAFTGSGGPTNMALNVTNAGTVDVGPGATVNFGGSTLTQSGGLTSIGTGATLNPLAPFVLGGGVLAGTGTVGVDLDSHGLVRPGSADAAGTLTVNGTYTQESDGILGVRVRQGASDRLVSSGAATIDGRLDLATVGAAPAEGEQRTVLTGASRTGTFSTVTGTGFDVAYTPTSVQLVAQKPPPAPPTGTTGTTGTTTTPPGSTTSPMPPTAVVAPSLVAVFPGTGAAAGATTVTVRGAGLAPGSTLTLAHPGQPTVVATDVTTGFDGRTLTATLPLAGAPLGPRDVVVSVPGRASVALPGAFRVVAVQAAELEAHFTGPSSASANYPYTGLLQVTNPGNVDATNAIVRIDGFPSGRPVEVSGPGVSATGLESPTEHGELITIARVPGHATVGARVRFVPVGAAHSHYELLSSVIEDSVEPADTGPATDPTLRIARQILLSSRTHEKGIFHVSGKLGTSDAGYEVKLTPGGDPVAPQITRTQHGDDIRTVFTGYLPAVADGPPAGGGNSRARSVLGSGAAAGLTGRIEVVLDQKKKLDDALEVVKDAYGVYKVTVDRRQVSRCLRDSHYISDFQYEALLRLADGGQTLKLLNTALDKSGIANQIVTSEFSVLTGFAYDAWESALVGSGFNSAGYLDTGAAQNPNSPFLGLSHANALAAVFEVCLHPKKLKSEPIPQIFDHYDHFGIAIYRPGDPNDKTGPQGAGKQHYVSGGAPLGYQVAFENVPTATAAAHEVTITDQLDPKRVDLSTLSLGPLYFGDAVAAPPGPSQTWSGLVDLRPAKNLVVSIDAGLDRGTGLLTWRLRGLDPLTGALATGPADGFLPPDTAPPVGRGGVGFTVSPVGTLKTGDAVTNGATIVFDKEQAIRTRVYANAIDTTAPTSAVRSVKRARSSCRALRVTWAGRDAGAGVGSYAVQVAKGKGRFRAWKQATTRRAATYRATGKRGTYRFRSIATDRVGHVQTRGLRSKALKLRC